ncbi:MAG: 2-amino-4-hydroxy-6-hydroxymethyldihydropteridine diphosphokinase [Gammaproteobacteria bacterium]|nr:2-amino-4-hydroxy-6-hydroxymethyldihydropteridine diphosphokinase [Gammaproteobacteria bacterium]
MPEQADVFVGLGSNLDNPERRVRRALSDLDGIPHTACTACSSLYASPPMGPPDQPDYVNAVARLSTSLAPLALLDALQSIEQAHQRTRDGQHWGPRTLDLDVLLYGDREIDDDRLKIPHPGLHERAFVIYPLLEIAGDIDIPGHGGLEMLAARCPRGELSRMESS